MTSHSPFYSSKHIEEPPIFVQQTLCLIVFALHSRILHMCIWILLVGYYEIYHFRRQSEINHCHHLQRIPVIVFYITSYLITRRSYRHKSSPLLQISLFLNTSVISELHERTDLNKSCFCYTELLETEPLSLI